MHFLICFLGLMIGTSAHGQSSTKLPEIHMVYMGGNDCPPCVAWRRFDLPQLEKSPRFQSIKFSHVQKVVRSAVPPMFFLPDDVKPLKEVLDAANGGSSGSAQVAILVNGAVYDYYFGTRDAASIEKMITSIQDGTPYPFARCIKMKTRSCVEQPSF